MPFDWKSYVTPNRWMSFYYQLTETLETNPKTALMIGVNDGVVLPVCRERGIKVYTYDHDAKAKPDFLGDLRNIDSTMADCDQTFDVVLCCQVLEHIEFDYFEKVVAFFEKIANKRAIISIPDMIAAKHSRISKYHKWEIGAPESSEKSSLVTEEIILKILEKYFSVEKYYHVKENPYHEFFILSKKSAPPPLP